ncbi:unnamed protein product [Prunus brigantina]
MDPFGCQRPATTAVNLTIPSPQFKDFHLVGWANHHLTQLCFIGCTLSTTSGAKWPLSNTSGALCPSRPPFSTSSNPQGCTVVLVGSDSVFKDASLWSATSSTRTA